MFRLCAAQFQRGCDTDDLILVSSVFDGHGVSLASPGPDQLRARPGFDDVRDSRFRIIVEIAAAISSSRRRVRTKASEGLLLNSYDSMRTMSSLRSRPARVY